MRKHVLFAYIKKVNKMTKKKTRNGNAYAMNRINKEQFEYMCSLGCKHPEVAGLFRVSEKTLYRWIRDTYGDYDFNTVRSWFYVSLKMDIRKQLERQMKYNPAVLIFQAKNHCGMADNPRQGDSDIKITVTRHSDIKNAEELENENISDSAESSSLDFDIDDDWDDE